MQFEILKSIVETEIEKFLLDYRNAMKLFNDDKKNGLTHAGEYGTYKENICKELFEFAIPGRFEIGSGFIYNEEKEMTTQVDVLIYAYDETPLMRLDKKQRFYPNETVRIIGEVKSVLTKKELGDALIKLAKNKAIRKTSSLAYYDVLEKRYDKENATSDGYSTSGVALKCNPIENPLDGLFSFLICDRIKGFNANLAGYINERYTEAGIEQHNRHNAIISITDGVLIYSMEGRPAQYPCKNNKEKYPDIIKSKSEVEHIKYLLSYINTHLKIAHRYYPEPLNYIW